MFCNFLVYSDSERTSCFTLLSTESGRSASGPAAARRRCRHDAGINRAYEWQSGQLIPVAKVFGRNMPAGATARKRRVSEIDGAVSNLK